MMMLTTTNASKDGQYDHAGNDYICCCCCLLLLAVADAASLLYIFIRIYSINMEYRNSSEWLRLVAIGIR